MKVVSPQDLRKLYAAAGITPREVEVRRRDDGTPYLHPPVKVFCFFAGFSTLQNRAPEQSMVFIKKRSEILSI